MTNHPQTADKTDFYFIGWKFHKSIKKKAMAQKFSGVRGLLISLSIAFFIVLTTAYFLSFCYKTVEENRFIENFNDNKVELTKN